MTEKGEVVLELIVNYKDGLKYIGEYQQHIENLKAKQKEYGDQLKAQTINKEQYRDSMNASSAAIKHQQENIRILNKELQNNVKQELASTGSIDGMKASLSKLTAQYGALSAEKRNGAKGLEIKNEIVAIDKALKDEEQSLGNFRRQVGNYEVATKSISAELKELTKQIVQMKLAGKEGSDEYLAAVKRASEVKDAFGDAAREINVGASDTKGLDRLKGAADGLAGSFTMLNSVQGIFTDDQEEMSRLVQKVQVGIGALSAGIALQNALQKEGIIMDTIRLVQSKARAAALALETKRTIGATVAQKILNAVAMANPYVLLTVALLSAAGAFAIFSLGSSKAEREHAKLNHTLDSTNRILDAMRDKLNFEIKIIEANGSDTDSVNQKRLKGLKDIQQAAQEALDTVRKNDHATAEQIEKAVEMEANAYKEYKAQLDDMAIYEMQKRTDKRKKDKENAKSYADAAKEARQKERDAVRDAQDSILAIVKEGKDKEIAATKIQYTRQIEDLRAKLNTEKGLTATARTAINQQIVALQTQQTQELAKIDKAFSTEQFNLQMEEQKMAIETRLLSVKEGSDAEHQLKRQSLTQVMEEELRANADKEERLQIDAQLIRDKYITQMEVAERDRMKIAKEKELDEVRFAIENKLITAQMAGENELQAKLEAKQAEIAMLARLEDEGDQAFINRKLQLAAEEKAIIRDIADTKTQETSDMLSAIGGAFGAISGLMEDMAEDNEALATFSKVLAIFEIGLNTASAFAAIPAMATKGDPYTYAIRVATAIATAVGAIGQAYAVINKQKQPKAPKLNKYATGGLVSGAGSGTSDSIPAMLSSGESVLNAMTTAMFAPILSSFNQIGGGVPIQIHNTSAQVMGEDMLARAFAKGAASLPTPVVNVQEITSAQARLVLIEQLGTM